MEQWFRAYDGNNVIAEMCSKRDRQNWHKRVWLFVHGWTHPDHRRQGHFRKLWKDRMDWTLSQTPRFIEGWCWDANKQFFLDDGFVVIERENHEMLMRKIL